jgi:hypothetical protein
MRFGMAQMRPRSKCVDFSVWQRSQHAAPATHNLQRARYFQNADPFHPIYPNENVTGKQRQLQSPLRAIAPLALRTKKWEVMLNLPLAEMLRDALLMAGNRVDREPFGRKACIRRETRRLISRPFDIVIYSFGQSFAILTWVGHFHSAPLQG